MLPVAFADQYRSEQRIVETPQQANKTEDPQQLLRTTTDPYGKALLLRDLAAQAVQKHDYGKARQYLVQNGRASCRASVCQYMYISEVAVSQIKKTKLKQFQQIT